MARKKKTPEVTEVEVTEVESLSTEGIMKEVEVTEVEAKAEAKAEAKVEAKVEPEVEPELIEEVKTPISQAVKPEGKIKETYSLLDSMDIPKVKITEEKEKIRKSLEKGYSREVVKVKEEVVKKAKEELIPNLVKKDEELSGGPKDRGLVNRLREPVDPARIIPADKNIENHGRASASFLRV